MNGPQNQDFDAVFVVDGQRENRAVTLPATFNFRARDVSFCVDPVDKESENEMTGRMYTEDGFADGSVSGLSVGGQLSSSNVFDIDLSVKSYDKEPPGPRSDNSVTAKRVTSH